MISERGKKLYDGISRKSLYLVAVPALVSLLVGGACWFLMESSLHILPVFGGTVAVAALLGTAVSFAVRQKMLNGISAEILKLLTDNDKTSKETSLKEPSQQLTLGDARAMISELKQMLEQVNEMNEAEQKKLEDTLTQASKHAQDVLKSLDITREKVLVLINNMHSPRSIEKTADD